MLLKHQKQGLELAQRHSRWAFFWDTGTGKTLLGLSIVKQKLLKTLIVAPKILLTDAWLTDAQQFYPTLSQNIVNWHTIKNKYDKKKTVTDANILLINYESLLSNKWILTDVDWEMLILDESQKIKNPKSSITKLILKNAIDIPYIYLLSGTPAPNTEMEYYPQIRLLMPDKIDKSWFKFRQQWFRPTDRYGWKWKLKDREKFLGLLQQCSSVVKKDDVLDLKGQFYRDIHYSFTQTEAKHYKDMLKKMLIEIDDNEISASQAITKLMKLRQITSGFIYNDNGKPVILGDSKFKALQQMLEILGNEQSIIWIQYDYEAEQLSQLPNSAVITGKVSDKERQRTLSEFRHGNIQYLIAHPKTIGHGVTLTNVTKAIYYSLSYSYEEFKQSQDRIYRYGQDKAVIYYILKNENKKIIDNVIFFALQNKETMLNYYLDALRNSV